MTRKIAVVGSRDFNDYEYLKSRLLKHFKNDDVLVSGGCRGADKLAERFANEYDFSTEIFPAEWDKYGRIAGFKRNKLIVEASDIVIAFFDGKSAGTNSTIKLAQDSGKTVKIYYYLRKTIISQFIQ